MPTTWPRTGQVAVASLFWVLTGVVVAAQEPTRASGESAAEGRLNEVAAAYQKLVAYADQGELVLSYRQGDTPRSIRLAVPLRYVRSERMLWDAMFTGIAADREWVTVVNPNLTLPFDGLVATDFLGRPEPPPSTKV